MKSIFRKLSDKIHEPKTERALIFILPAVTLLICAVILAPRLWFYIDSAAMNSSAQTASAPEVSSLPSPSASAVPTAAVTEAPVPTQAPTAAPAPNSVKTAVLSGSSTERDLFVRLKDENGNALTGEKYTLNFTFPDGTQASYKTETDGTCYLVKLDAGDYTVALDESSGISAEPVKCSVKSKVEYKQIEDIDEMLDVKDNTELSQSEIKTVTNSAPEIETEYLRTPVDIIESAAVTEQTPVLDESGNQAYKYSFPTGANGCIMLSDGVTESDVIPVDENEDGTAEYGLRWVEEANGESSNVTGYYQGVELYDAAGIPLANYYSSAVPVTQEVKVLMGWQSIDGKTMYYDGYGNPVTGLKNIDGKMYFFNQYGVCASSLGVDVSFYNEGINWPAVKAQGIDFAIIRVGGRGWETGLLYDDVCFVQNLRGAKAAGLKVGVYFYSTAIDAVEAVQEASLVLERLNGVALDYPVFIDVEQSGDYPLGRSDQLSKAQRSEIINAFCATVMNSGYRAGVYSGQSFFKYNLEYSALSQYTIWLASYTSAFAPPDFSWRYDIWQFTDAGVVNGINGKVDMNIIY